MAGVFKRITAKSITRHTAHKEYDLTFSSGSEGISSASFDGLEAIYLNARDIGAYYFNTTDFKGLQDYSSSIQLFFNSQTQYGPGTFDFANTIRSKFYKTSHIPGYNAPLMIKDSTSTFALPHLMIGDGIKPGTVQIASASTHNYSDDGNGTLLRNEIPHNLSSSRANLGYQLYTGNFFHYNPIRPGKVYNLTEHNTAPNQDITGIWYGVQPSMVGSTTGNPDINHGQIETFGTARASSGLILSQSTHTALIAQHWYPDAPQAIFDTLNNNPQDSFDDQPPIHVGKLNLPITYVPSTPDTFSDGLTIWALFKHIKGYVNNGASGRKHILWTLGPCSDSNGSAAANIDSCLYLEYEDDGKIKLLSSKLGDRQTLTSINIDVSDDEVISVCVTVNPDGTYRMVARNWTDDASDAVQIVIPDHMHNSSVSVNERKLVIGAGYYPTSMYDRYHSFTGGILFDFRVWDKDIGPNAANQLRNLEFSEAGNVFYEDGIINVADMNDGTSQHISECTLGFKNTVEREEYEYTCMVQDNEYNMSQNPTILQSGSTADKPVPKPFISDGNWDPYISTIGLYNDSNELLAIGKLGRPIRKVETYDQTFIVKWDK